MQQIMLKSKLHQARVTDVLIDYEGSIEIDEDLMDQVGILTHEQVHVSTSTMAIDLSPTPFQGKEEDRPYRLMVQLRTLRR